VLDEWSNQKDIKTSKECKDHS